MDLLQPHSGQEAATIDISKEAAACASWPTRERLRALKRIIPRADIERGPQRTGKGRAYHAPNNVAKSSLIPDSVISRAQLRPTYGHGWQPRIDPLPKKA